MDEQYTHAVLRAVVVQLCQPLGLNALQSSACDVLVYLLKSYLHIVAKTTAGYNIHGEGRGRGGETNRKEGCVVMMWPLLVMIVVDLGIMYSLLEANRTEPNLSDLALAFQDLGIYLCEVSELCRELDSNPYVYILPNNPDPKKSCHVYNGISSHIMVRRVLSSNEGCIPPLLPQKDDDSDNVCIVCGKERSFV